MNKKKITYGLASLGVMASGMVGITVFADGTDVIDEINITVPVSCTMSGTGMTSHNADISNGTYQANIGTTTLHAFCNDNSGFAIYAAGYTGDEIGGTNSNKLVGTSASGNATIVTGTATSAGDPDVSNWAMKLTMAQDSGDTTSTNAFTIDNSFNAYHEVPNSYTKVAHKNAGTDMTAITGGVKLTTTYAAYISKTQPADTYSGQVIYTLVHPSSAEPSELTPPTSCTTPVTGLIYMQDLTSSNKATILSNMTEDAEYYLADKRDDKTYCVAKLKDGNLWMTQNLDHDIVTDGTVIYDNTTTDLGWNGTSYNAASWTPSTATYDASATTWNYSNTTPESYDPGELYWNGELLPDNQSDCEAVGGTWHSGWCYVPGIASSTGNSHYHLGNYYNWTAAVAMNDSSSYTTNNTDVNQSICPAGWTLPKSGYATAESISSGSFQYLFERYGWDSNSYTMEGSDIWNTAIKMFRSGYYNPTDWDLSNLIGSTGSYSSSVVTDQGYAFSFENSLELDPNAGIRRDFGASVRCLAR